MVGFFMSFLTSTWTSDLGYFLVRFLIVSGRVLCLVDRSLTALLDSCLLFSNS